MQLRESSGTPDSLQEPAAMETNLQFIPASAFDSVACTFGHVYRHTHWEGISTDLLDVVKPWRAESVKSVMAEPHPLNTRCHRLWLIGSRQSNVQCRSS